MDIALEDDADDPIYLDALEEGVEQSLKAAQADLVIYLAGADPYAAERNQGITRGRSNEWPHPEHLRQPWWIV